MPCSSCGTAVLVAGAREDAVSIGTDNWVGPTLQSTVSILLPPVTPIHTGKTNPMCATITQKRDEKTEERRESDRGRHRFCHIPGSRSFIATNDA